MKRISLFFVLIFVFLSLQAQPYLNQREHFGYVNSQITSILVDQDGYYLAGIILDTVLTGGYTWQSFFMKTDFEGDTIFNYKLTFPAGNLELWGEDPFFTRDSSIIVYGSWLENYKYGLITEFSKEGELLRKKKIYNPIHPDGHSITLDQIRELPSGNFLFTATAIDSGKRAYSLLGKMNPDFDILWHKTYGDSLRYGAYSLLLDDNSNLLIGSRVMDRSKVWYDFHHQINIIKTDTSGNVFWDFTSEVKDSLAFPFDMVFDEEGNVMIATSSVWEKQDTIIDNIFGRSYLKPAVVKFDTTEKKIIWEKTIEQANWYVQRPLERILATKDKDGFVCAGQISTVRHDSTYRELRGLIFKITPEGDTSWVRTYQYLTDGEREQYFYDMEITPDGGYVAGGLSSPVLLTPDESPWIRTWMVKTDKHGCLVPGCEKTSSLIALGENEVILKIFPNPVSEQLNFYLKYQKNLKNISCRIIDMNGREIKKYSDLSNDTTFILPIGKLHPGSYFLQILEGSKILKTEKIIKI